MFGDGLLVLLHRPAERFHVLRIRALLEPVDQAFHGLDGLLRLAQLAVEFRQSGAGILVLGKCLPHLAQSLRRLPEMTLLGIDVGQKNPRARVVRLRGKVALHLFLCPGRLAGFLPEKCAVQPKILVLAAECFELFVAFQRFSLFSRPFVRQGEPFERFPVRGLRAEHRRVLLDCLGEILQPAKDAGQTQARLPVARLHGQQPAQLLHGLGELALLFQQRGEVLHRLRVAGVGLHGVPVDLRPPLPACPGPPARRRGC